jgi:hypothetical protein
MTNDPMVRMKVWWDTEVQTQIRVVALMQCKEQL